MNFYVNPNRNFDVMVELIFDYMQSCRHEGWSSVAKFLTEDVPLILKSENLKEIPEVLSVVYKSPPSELREFITWIAEVRRQEDGNLTLSEEEKGRLAIKVLKLFTFPFEENNFTFEFDKHVMHDQKLIL